VLYATWTRPHVRRFEKVQGGDISWFSSIPCHVSPLLNEYILYIIYIKD
jgi:hypothetical protein